MSAAVRHLSLVAALFFSVLMPLLMIITPRWSVAVLPAAADVRVNDAAVSGEPGVQPITNAVEVSLPPAKVHGSAARKRQTHSTRVLPEIGKQPIPRRVFAPSAAAQLSPLAVPRKVDWKGLILSAWLLGSTLVAIQLCFSYLCLWRLSRRSTVVERGEWLRLAQQTARVLNIYRPVRVCKSNEIDVPIATGLVYPIVILPADADEWTTERLRIVLLHEFAHVKRLDTLTQWIGHLAMVMYWFHPLVWWATRKMRTHRERACDDLVLGAGAKASDYASDLLAFGSQASGGAAYVAALAMARKSQLEGRLLAVLNNEVSRTSVNGRAVAFAALIAFIVALPITALHAIATQSSTLTDKALAFVEGNAPSKAQIASSAKEVAIEQKEETESTVTDQVQTETTIESAQSEEHPHDAPKEQAAGSRDTESNSAQETPSTPAPPAAPPRPSSNSYSYGYVTSDDQLQAFECRSDGHNVSNWINENGSGRRTWKANWSGITTGGERCQISFHAEGAIVFNADLTGIQSIPPGGFLEISESIGNHFRKLTAKPSATGNGVEMAWTVDAQARELGPQERQWLAAFLLSLERQSAFSAETRVPALLKKGGPNAVLNEVNNISTDYARSRYLLLMLENAKLDNAQLLRVIDFTGRSMASDYEHARVLLAISKNYSLDDETSRKAFLNSANELKSDYEHGRVLMELLKRPRLSIETRNTAIQSAGNIQSDYERARVLIAAVCDCSNTPAAPLPRVFFETVNRIQSDYEHGRVLISILDSKKQQLSAEDAKAILESAVKIQSDYEKRRVLTAFIERKLLNESLVPLFVDASKAIQSDNDHATVLMSLINSNQVNGNQVEAVINSAATISSDYELSRVLMAIAAGYPLKANVRSTYIKVAQQIHSEYERNRTLAAVTTSTML